ncbi:hypothetical protein BEP19_13670 [Ammoniphilus oxalaticus]|uniref:Uncharacterized protein n=1 Tax=Ammoniphilus oxalaticus TaxID=66863 RepID=A0A419SEG5_9BACL|nr:hypothetical protein [Ammoniphilus oxalaticus]RKD21681.1 hypothetical protein BEP19_13670 [Ammoniphilus oxalaticus]
MGTIELQPELRGPGGETLSIHRDGDWIGDLYLIYREQDQLLGTVQLDEEYVSPEQVGEIVEQLESYVTSLVFALGVQDHHVHVFYGSYSMLDDYMDYADDVELGEDEGLEYERWIVGQSEQGIEYQIYDQAGELVAEAIVDIKGTDVVGEIHFTFEPSPREMEDIEAILLKDYDHDLIDQYQFTLFVDGTHMGQLEHDEPESSERDEVIVDQMEADAIYDLVDNENRPLAKASCYYEDDGADITVELKVKPNEDTTHHVMQTVFQEVLSESFEWINIRMLFKGKQVDGFHFERGKNQQYV